MHYIIINTYHVCIGRTFALLEEVIPETPLVASAQLGIYYLIPSLKKRVNMCSLKYEEQMRWFVTNHFY